MAKRLVLFVLITSLACICTSSVATPLDQGGSVTPIGGIDGIQPAPAGLPHSKKGWVRRP